MGVDSTLSPTPQGKARMAIRRKAEEMIRSASRWSRRARAAAAQALESLGRPVHLSVAPEQERGPLFRLENGTVSVVEEIARC